MLKGIYLLAFLFTLLTSHSYSQNLDEIKKYETCADELLVNNYDLAFTCVGPRNISSVPSEFHKLDCPIYSLENEPDSVNHLREKLNKKNIYFGVPDVIASLTASPENLLSDSLSLHTENGDLYL